MANLNPAQLEQLSNIGAYLQQQRERLGKPIDDVASETFIRTTLLRAIEIGDAEVLPESVFIKGFIRRYGDALGLDGTAIAQAFDVQPASVAFMGSSSATENPVASQQPKPSVALVEKVDTARGRPLVPLGIAGAFAVVVGGAIALTQTVGVESQRGTPSNAESASESALDEGAGPDGSVTASDNATATPQDPESDVGTPESSSEAPIVVSVNLNGDAWMRVIADGTSVYEGILAQGSAQTWTAEQEIRITTGNAGAVSLSHNGGEADPVGEPGSVRTLTFTASN